MKPITLALLVLLSVATSAFSQQQESPAPPVETNPTAARVLGNLQDGTPPPPEAPKPEFIVPAKDIISSETHEQGGREITIREIEPIALPQPPKTSSEPVEISPAFQARIDAYRTEHPRANLVQIGANVYHSKDAAPRTLATYRPGGEETAVTFCSSADFSLLSGFSSFVDSQGQTRSLLMMWSTVDIALRSEFLASHGGAYQPPAMPELPDGKATFAVTSENPSAETLATIQSLHDLYNNEYQKLKAAHERREQAHLSQEAKLKAHPPKPKDIILNHWRIGTPAPQKGETAR